MDCTLDLIKRRRSIRAYNNQPLTRSQVKALLDAGRYAPSGHNRQCWHFTAVTSPAVLAELNRLVRDGFLRLNPGDSDPVELHDAKRKVENQGDGYCFSYHAPCLIIASASAGAHNGRADCSCALENMFLTACDMGLGSCWVNQLHWLDANPALHAYLETLGIPPNHTICGAGVFGTPCGPVPQASPRKENTWNIVE